jgi:predicted SAM-dependent methyltransferase
MYQSETSVCRERLKKFCFGDGLDLGFGGDPIIPSAITVDMNIPYAEVGCSPQHLHGDARNLCWFKDGVLDYVYSSHLLEDFPEGETGLVLTEWMRVIKPGGFLILYCPDEQKYREHCRLTGQGYNEAHKVSRFSLDYVKQVLSSLGVAYSIVHENAYVDGYSFEIVVMKPV